MNNLDLKSPQIISLKNTSNLFKLVVISMLLLGIAACKTTKRTALKKSERDKPEVLFDEMIKNQVNADWFEGRVKMRFADE